ncbi:MAG: ECF transporter S component [Clostridiales bacterium]|nr:ECF transporter S component [Clostridiales bacterium]
MNIQKQTDIRKLTLAAMLAALAYVVNVLCHLSIVPAAPFLTYDPMDVIIALGGLILGPFYALMITIVAAMVEWFTISDTGIIGFLMNVLSSGTFACTAAFIYHRKRTLKNAVLGLVAGTLVMVAAMLLWNYIITPLYMNVTREQVVAMLPTVFLPFNVIKGGLNAALTFLLYRPVIGMLRSAKLMPASKAPAKKMHIVPILVAALIVVTCVLVILSLKGII